MSSHVKYSLQAFWAVSIRELHMSLWRPWSEISDAASSEISSIVDSTHCQQLAIDLRWGSPKLFPVRWCNLFVLHSRNQEPHSENIIVIKSPKPPLVLGPPPRLAYPLVVFLIRETETDEISHPDDTVRDSIIASPRHLLSTAWLTRLVNKFDALDSKTHLTMILWKHRLRFVSLTSIECLSWFCNTFCAC